jgi:hypothetical protein
VEGLFKRGLVALRHSTSLSPVALKEVKRGTESRTISATREGGESTMLQATARLGRPELRAAAALLQGSVTWSRIFRISSPQPGEKYFKDKGFLRSSIPAPPAPPARLSRALAPPILLRLLKLFLQSSLS